MLQFCDRHVNYTHEYGDCGIDAVLLFDGHRSCGVWRQRLDITQTQFAEVPTPLSGAAKRQASGGRFDKCFDSLFRWPRTGEPLCMLVALTAKICHPLAAQEGEVSLHACLH